MKRHFGSLRRGIFLLPMLVLAVSLGVNGCGGSDEYDEPRGVSNAALEGHATNALIEADTLKAWMDEGLVNAEDSFDGKVVLMDYASADSAKRIPGACKVTTAEFTATRLEGLADSGTMVPTGAMMDAVLQRLGIDENTTVVFTSTSMFQATLGYFTFRYWGFPIERLKVLNGGNSAWNAAVAANGWDASYALTDVVPNPAPSAYSVRNLGKLNDDLRYSIGEMITHVVPALQAGTMLHLDALGQPAHANGTSPTTSLTASGKFVVFEGRIRGSAPLSQATLFGADGRYKNVEDDDADATNDIRSLFEATGWYQGLPTMTACRAGVSCTALYFALEAILGSPAYVYDGSWGQWGLYSSSTANGGPTALAGLTGERAKWAVDQYTISGGLVAGYPLSDLPRYNFPDNGKLLTEIETVTIKTDVLNGTNGPADPRANQIENADREYIETPAAGGAPTANSGGSGGGC